MGEAKRKQELAATVATQLLIVPEPDRDRLADEIAATTFFHVGGTCALRNALGQRLLADRLGIMAPLVVGGMIYRGGTDPIRDSLAFCGKDNRLAKYPG